MIMPACNTPSKANLQSSKKNRISGKLQPMKPWGESISKGYSSGIRSSNLSSRRVSEDDDEEYDNKKKELTQQVLDKISKYHKHKKGLFRSKNGVLLDLGGMGLSTLPDEVVAQMLKHSVERLSLSRNEPMLVVPDGLVQGCQNGQCPPLITLKVLDLSRCHIVILPEEWDLPHLTRLDLSHNRIRDFPSKSVLRGIPLLQDLNMYNNRLHHIPGFYAVVPGAAPGATAESTQSTEGGAITRSKSSSSSTIRSGGSANRSTSKKADPTSLSYDASLLAHLTLLNVGCNELTYLPDVLPVRLKTLILCNNYLTQIPPSLILGVCQDDPDAKVRHVLPPLKELDITSNPVKLPPLAICEAGIKAMRKYFEKELVGLQSRKLKHEY